MERRRGTMEMEEILRLRGEVSALRLQMRDKDRMVETLGMRVESLTDELRELRREMQEGFRGLDVSETQHGIQEVMGTLTILLGLVRDL